LIGAGLLVGLAAFSAVIFAAPLESTVLFFAGAILIGFGSGLFSVSTLTAAMLMPAQGLAGRGLALGAWGAAQATAAGVSIAIGGMNAKAMSGAWGEPLMSPATGYSFVYHTEIALIFVTLIVLGPLVRFTQSTIHQSGGTGRIGLADFPT